MSITSKNSSAGKRYSAKTKSRALKLLKNGHAIPDVAHRIGASWLTINDWKKKSEQAARCERELAEQNRENAEKNREKLINNLNRLLSKSDEQWNYIESVISSKNGKIRPGKRFTLGGRLFVEAVLHRHQMNIPWTKLPEQFGDYLVVSARFNAWINSGKWEQILKLLDGLDNGANAQHIMGQLEQKVQDHNPDSMETHAAQILESEPLHIHVKVDNHRVDAEEKSQKPCLRHRLAQFIGSFFNFSQKSATSKGSRAALS